MSTTSTILGCSPITFGIAYQIRIASPVLLFAHPENLSTARDALQKFDSIQIRVALVDDEPGLNLGLTSVNSLIQESTRYPSYVEHKLGPGKGKSTIAFLCYSSGTTGNPKVSTFVFSFMSRH